MFSKRDNHTRFREMSEPHINFLYNMALRYTGNTFDAEDLVQEALYIACKEFPKLRDPSRFKAWAFTILRNLHLKEIRNACRRRKFEWEEKQDYVEQLENLPLSGDTERLLEKKFEESAVREIVDELPEKYKSPILLYYMEGLSYRETAEYLELPVGTVMSRLSRAKAWLKKKMIRFETASDKNVVAFRKREHREGGA